MQADGPGCAPARNHRPARGAPVRRRGRERHDDTGSALFLMPVGVLIVLLLGALIADTAYVFMAEREVIDGATAAANDAAAAAVDLDHFRSTGEVRLRPERIEALAREAVRRRTSGMFTAPPTITVHLSGPDAVVVELEGPVEGLLWSPAGAFDRSVRARVVAHADPGLP